MGAEIENNSNHGKKVGNNYYLYKHSSKRVHGKKNPVPVDTCIGKITPEGIEKSGSKKVAVNDTVVIVKEYGFSRSVEALCPAGWKEPLGIKWQEVLDFILVRESPESYISQIRKVPERLDLAELQRHMPFPNGVPSVSTMSRMQAAVDEEMVCLALVNWIGEVFNTRGIHIAIDGKGLRAAARKVRDEKTPYILNAVDTASKLVIGQLVIHGKANEMTVIPELVELLEIEGSTITIDVIGATENIMNTIHGNGGEFVLQVKKNCPELYAEFMGLFEGLSEDRENNPEEFQDKYGSHYSEAKTAEKNRERYEYRTIQSYSDPGGIQESRPYIASTG